MKKYAEKSRLILQNINNEIGVDFTQYSDNEAINKIVELINIQKYSLQRIYKPVIFCLLLFLTGFWLFTFNLFGYILYGILGSMLFITVGIFFGLIMLLKNLKADLKYIISSALDHTLNICNDFYDD